MRVDVCVCMHVGSSSGNGGGFIVSVRAVQIQVFEGKSFYLVRTCVCVRENVCVREREVA